MFPLRKLCYHGMSVFSLFSIGLLLSGPATHAATVFPSINHHPGKRSFIVRGRVTDEKNQGLPGANIQEKGTKNGVVTDAKGNFTLTVQQGNATLIVSYVGYGNKEIAVNNQADLTIVLTESQNKLNDVIVVGYGTQKKATLTGAVSQVKGDVVKSSPNGNLSNNLTGRTPGLIAVNRSGEPGNDGSTLSVRGTASFRNSNAGPLIVVDGIPDRSFSRINPDDIESVSVLKDASAAIYGVRAANGVVLITTKRGKSGKPVVNYTGSYSLQSPTRVPKLVNAAQYATYFNELNDRLGQPKQYTDEDIKLYADGTDPLGHPSTDWYKTVLAKSAPQTQHEVSISGGSETVKYYFSGQYLYQDYLFNNSPFNFNQKNVRANIDANISKNLKVSLDLAGRNEDKYAPLSNSNANGGIFMSILGQYPTLPAKYPNGLPGLGNTVGSNPYMQVSDKPGYNKNLSWFVTTTGTVDLKLPFITEGLYATAYAALDNTFYQNKSLSRPFDVYQYNTDTREYVNFRSNTSGNKTSLTEYMGRWRRNTYNIKLGYDHLFNNIHNISAIVGYEVSDYFLEETGATNRNLLSDQLPFIGLGSTDPANIGNSGYGDQNGRKSGYGRINYGYNDKYLFEFSGRYNGSYNFAPGKQYGFFPGLSAGWVLSKESFVSRAVPFLNFAKIRASWGILGDDGIGAYQFLGLYNFANPGYFLGPDNTPVPGLTTGVSPNPNFTWEKVESKDIGIETAFFNSKLTVNADYFLRKRYDILTPRNASVPSYTGLSSKLPPENIGKANSNGFELEIGHNNTIGNDFSYNVSANLTYTTNKIVFSDESPNVLPYQRQTGYPIRSFLIYKTDGIYNTQEEIDNFKNDAGKNVTPLTGTKPGDIKYVDVNGDGKITSADQVRYFDSPVPKVVYGISMGANYKGFALNILFYGQQGAKQIIRPQGTNEAFTPPVWEYEGRWTPDNPNAAKPAAFDRTSTVNNVNSDFWLNDVSFLRLKNVELSYEFSSSLLSGIKVKRMRVFLNGSNLFLISKVKDYDPELDNDYVNGAYYPQLRIIGGGINVSF